jgi:hypothetical protein
METAIGTAETSEDSSTSPTRAEVKPIHVSSAGRREIDEATVAELVKALERDGHFLHPIVVRAEGADNCRLIAGAHRLEAWERQFGEQRPIPAIVYPPDTPDALITVLKIEENLLRKELSAAEREAQTIRLAAELKKLKLATELGEVAETGNPVPGLAPASGGRGRKGVAQTVAEKAGVTRRAVNKRLKAASAVIGESIDLDRDTPEELERKADKRQHAGKIERPKRSKPAGVMKGPTKPPAAEVDSQIEDLWQAFEGMDRTHQLRFIYCACLRLGLDALRMAPPAEYGLVDEDPELAVELPAEVGPASDDAAADLHEQRDDAEDPCEDLQDDGDAPEARQEVGGAARCGYCRFLIEGLDRRQMFDGRLYHADCVKYAKRISVAAE